MIFDFYCHTGNCWRTSKQQATMSDISLQVRSGMQKRDMIISEQGTIGRCSSTGLRWIRKQPFFESDNQMFYTIVENVNYGAFPGHAKSSHKSEKVPIESSHKNENVPIESSHKEVKLGKTACANTWSIPTRDRSLSEDSSQETGSRSIRWPAN